MFTLDNGFGEIIFLFGNMNGMRVARAVFLQIGKAGEAFAGGHVEVLGVHNLVRGGILT